MQWYALNIKWRYWYMRFDESVLILICMSTNEREWVVNEVNPVCTWVRMTHNEASVQNMYATHGVWHIMHSVTILHAAKWVFYASYRQCLWYQMMWYDLECNINEHIMHPVRNETNSGKKRDHTLARDRDVSPGYRLPCASHSHGSVQRYFAY